MPARSISSRRFCSLEATASGEPLCATAPEADAILLIPTAKAQWPNLDVPAQIGRFSPESDLGRALSIVSRPLVAFYHSDAQDEILFSSAETKMQRFTAVGGAVDTLECLVLALCTDGRKDACCAKFGFPLLRALSNVPELLVLQVSHLGGCRFAPTVLFLSSGHCYGRLTSASVLATVEAERAGRLYPETFRGSVYGSELDCWALLAWQQRFGYVPALSALTSTKEGSLVRVIEHERGDQLVLEERCVRYPLFSGCSHLTKERLVDRLIYDTFS